MVGKVTVIYSGATGEAFGKGDRRRSTCLQYIDAEGVRTLVKTRGRFNIWGKRFAETGDPRSRGWQANPCGRKRSRRTFFFFFQWPNSASSSSEKMGEVR